MPSSPPPPPPLLHPCPWQPLSVGLFFSPPFRCSRHLARLVPCKSVDVDRGRHGGGPSTASAKGYLVISRGADRLGCSLVAVLCAVSELAGGPGDSYIRRLFIIYSFIYLFCSPSKSNSCGQIKEASREGLVEAWLQDRAQRRESVRFGTWPRPLLLLLGRRFARPKTTLRTGLCRSAPGPGEAPLSWSPRRWCCCFERWRFLVNVTRTTEV